MELHSIGEVAASLGVPVSTLHYWESCGLIEPYRRSGRRYYDTDQLYRIALIRTWRAMGRLSLDDIAALLNGDGKPRDWRATVTARIEAIEAQVSDLLTARAYLDHLMTCRHEGALDECPHFRAAVDLPLVNVAK
ncbi:MerR family transcriptional regulator [Amycolatopsis jejuensis]|uniref:MerR family transcriptional regulator n=1 Tax=Amycolatopsis jejuensis TaxID=330084 RepID=UPI000527AD9C|nr:MerR family transcriptional regulator [Amycolatopsis jejuensis]